MAIIDPSDTAAGVKGGFVLHNTHSAPTRFDDLQGGNFGFGLSVVLIFAEAWTATRQLPAPAIYTGADVSGTFTITYSSGGPTSDPVVDYVTQPRYVDTQPLWGIQTAPFFYEDHRAQFYVTTTVDTTAISDSRAFGMSQAHAVTNPVTKISQLSVERPAGSNGLARAGRTPSDNIRVALSTTAPVTYQGRLITSSTSMTTEGQP